MSKLNTITNTEVASCAGETASNDQANDGNNVEAVDDVDDGADT